MASWSCFGHSLCSRLANDAYEKNCGMIFEYGHTVSHAIEKARDGRGSNPLGETTVSDVSIYANHLF